MVLASAVSVAQDAKAITIYTSSNETFIRPIFEEFTKETGVKVNFISDKGPVLIEKLKAEGEKSSADVFMTVDVGNLWLASQAGLLAPTKSSVIEKNIPSQYREPSNEWVGLSIRARTLFYNPKKVKETELKNYQDLASKKWHKRLCLRTSNNVYNQSLVASFIENKGAKETESMVKGWVGNLATDVFTSDTLLLKAIEDGKCEVGIANSYYYARILKENPDFGVKVFWPTDGVHVNVMGGGVVKNSSNKKEAVRFLEWATTPKAQKLFASMNFEYPVNQAADVDPLVAAWGKFNADKMPLFKAGEKQQAAVQLMDRVGYR
ncbi:extracellular solute-binding protein [bacterium]|nr:extracellular solute-binding protein [bacterium]